MPWWSAGTKSSYWTISPPVRGSNIAHLVGRPDFTFVEGTTLDPDLVEKLAVDTDAIVHLAAAVGVRLIVDHPLESIITNIRGTEHVLSAAAALHRGS